MNISKGGDRMLKIDENWKKENNECYKNLEYRERDFYGPFLEMKLRKFDDGRLFLIPTRKIIETAEYSETDFALICKAVKEIHEKIGRFTLKIPYRKIEIEIDSTDADIESLILQKLKSIRLI